MELKTKVNAEVGKQELWIAREFDLPLDLLFKAYVESEIVAQWMGTNVLKLENKNMVAINLKPPTHREINTGSMEPSMSLSSTGKSPGHSKWRIPHFLFSWNSWNLKK